MTDDPAREIHDRDQLLELLYWMEGEGFGENTTVPALSRFLDFPEARVAAALRVLRDRGDVHVKGPTDNYHLTETGRSEAARRFAEEFAPMLRQGHGECSDPGCDCHTAEHGGADCRARATPSTNRRG